MWTYTTYMIYAFLQNRKGRVDHNKPAEVNFKDLTDFVFRKLWGEGGLVFHDSDRDLENDLKLLDKLGIIQYDTRQRIITMEPEEMKILDKIAHGMREDPVRHRVPIINEYLSRIEKAIPA